MVAVESVDQFGTVGFIESTSMNADWSSYDVTLSIIISIQENYLQQIMHTCIWTTSSTILVKDLVVNRLGWYFSTIHWNTTSLLDENPAGSKNDCTEFLALTSSLTCQSSSAVRLVVLLMDKCKLFGHQQQSIFEGDDWHYDFDWHKSKWFNSCKQTLEKHHSKLSSTR